MEGVEAYFKICRPCDNYYRYQEIEDSVHNFDDTFLLGIDVCIYLSSCSKNNVAVGTLYNIMKDLWEFKIDKRKVLNAYAHFQALSERPYDFNCVICGYHLTILIADVNRKVGFRYTAEGEEPSDNKLTGNSSDYVNSDDFWDSVVTSILSRGFVGRTFKNLLINLSLIFGRHL